MKALAYTTVFLMALTGTSVIAQDYDDIYYSPKKAKESEHQKAAESKSTQDSRKQKRYMSQENEQQSQSNSDYSGTSRFDSDDYYDYAYASRIRRFNRPCGFGYYDSYYTNAYWYNYNPAYYGVSIYSGYNFWGPSWGWATPGWSFGFSYNYGYPYYGGWNSPAYYGYNPYYGGWGGWGYNNYWNGYNDGYYNGYAQGYYNGGGYYNSYDYNSSNYNNRYYGRRNNYSSNGTGGGRGSGGVSPRNVSPRGGMASAGNSGGNGNGGGRPTYVNDPTIISRPSANEVNFKSVNSPRETRPTTRPSVDRPAIDNFRNPAGRGTINNRNDANVRPSNPDSRPVRFNNGSEYRFNVPENNANENSRPTEPVRSNGFGNDRPRNAEQPDRPHFDRDNNDVRPVEQARPVQRPNIFDRGSSNDNDRPQQQSKPQQGNRPQIQIERPSYQNNNSRPSNGGFSSPNPGGRGFSSPAPSGGGRSGRPRR